MPSASVKGYTLVTPMGGNDSYLIDMDGVIHRGGRLIPGADRLIGKPPEVDLPSRSPTNNSQRSRRDVATWLRLLTHLAALEPIVEEDQ